MPVRNKVKLIDTQIKFLEHILHIYEIDSLTKLLPKFKNRIKNILKQGWYYTHGATSPYDINLVDSDKEVLNKITSEYKENREQIKKLLKDYNELIKEAEEYFQPIK
jgi:hypothetical protein